MSEVPVAMASLSGDDAPSAGMLALALTAPAPGGVEGDGEFAPDHRVVAAPGDAPFAVEPAPAGTVDPATDDDGWAFSPFITQFVPVNPAFAPGFCCPYMTLAPGFG